MLMRRTAHDIPSKAPLPKTLPLPLVLSEKAIRNDRLTIQALGEENRKISQCTHRGAYVSQDLDKYAERRFISGELELQQESIREYSASMDPRFNIQGTTADYAGIDADLDDPFLHYGLNDSSGTHSGCLTLHRM